MSATFDLLGYLQIDPLRDQESAPLQRRVSKSRTLDADVSVRDRGFTHGDRTFTYAYKPVSEYHDSIARRLLEIHPRVYIGNVEGVFECAPSEFDDSAEENTFIFEVIRKLTE
ncbi:MAG: hypothetical protein AAGI72_23725 [Pseudomonadota bacterium]